MIIFSFLFQILIELFEYRVYLMFYTGLTSIWGERISTFSSHFCGKLFLKFPLSVFFKCMLPVGRSLQWNLSNLYIFWSVDYVSFDAWKLFACSRVYFEIWLDKNVFQYKFLRIRVFVFNLFFLFRLHFVDTCHSVSIY